MKQSQLTFSLPNVAKILLALSIFLTPQYHLHAQGGGHKLKGAKISKADTTPSTASDLRIGSATTSATTTTTASARPAFEDITLHRIMVSVTVPNAKDANTDHNVYVLLRGTDKFFLNYGKDDFEKGSTGYYDILPKDVNKIRDIQFLKLGITGTDAIMIGQISLYLNGHLAYQKTFPAGKWLEKEGSSQSELLIPYQELRAHAGWKYPSTTSTMWKAPTVIRASMISSVIESAIGNQMSKDPNIAWGDKNTSWGKHVELKYVSPTTIHVDLDLEKSARLSPDPELDVDFDLVFSCNNGALKMQIVNVKVGTDIWGKINIMLRGKLKYVICEGISEIVPIIGKPAEEYCEGYLAKFLDFKLDFAPAGSTPPATCRNIRVNPDLSISLQ
ncbi:MAG: hypothetical protein JNL70_06785 [Saprospiraceae bacterium]|nr:hypothetical protein [Saprospiraceae bacterium]